MRGLLRGRWLLEHNWCKACEGHLGYTFELAGNCRGSITRGVCPHTLRGETQGLNHLEMHLHRILQICQTPRMSHGFISFSLWGQLYFSSTAQATLNRDDS